MSDRSPTRGPSSALLSALTWAAIAVLVLGWLPVLVAVRVLDRDPARYRTGRLFRKVGLWITRLSPAWRIVRSGRLPDDPRLPYVVVANHQSHADVPVISTLPWEMKWVAKAELFRVPVSGWMMHLAGDIPVDRAARRSRVTVVRRARFYLGHRCSVMFMPEGTRSKDGRVKAFQDGAFRLAIEAGVPVLPLALDGTADALAKNGWRFGPATCRLHVLEPIETAGLSPDDAAVLRDRVRQAIVDQIASWRGVAAEAVDGTRERPAVDAPEAVEEPTNSPPGAISHSGAG